MNKVEDESDQDKDHKHPEVRPLHILRHLHSEYAHCNCGHGHKIRSVKATERSKHEVNNEDILSHLKPRDFTVSTELRPVDVLSLFIKSSLGIFFILKELFVSILTFNLHLIVFIVLRGKLFIRLLSNHFEDVERSDNLVQILFNLLLPLNFLFNDIFLVIDVEA